MLNEKLKMVACDAHLTTTSDLMGLSYWVTLTVTIFVALTRFTWDDRKYAFYRLQVMLIPQSLLFYYSFFWLGLNGFSAWLVWRCHDWDDSPGTLIVYIVKIMVISFIGPSFMLTTLMWIPISVTCAALVLSIINCILFSIKNEWAGVCGVVDLTTTTLLIFELVYLKVWRHSVIDEWFRIKDSITDFSTKPLDSQLESSDDDTVQQPQMSFQAQVKLPPPPNPEDESEFVEKRIRSRFNTNTKKPIPFNLRK